MLESAWIEGHRTFEICFGTAGAAVCLCVVLPTLWWVLPRHRVWLFPPRVDRGQGVQIAYGLFGVFMAVTDAFCGLIPHGPLPGVLAASFMTTAIIGIALGPRVVYLAMLRRSARPVSETRQSAGLASP